MSRSAVVVAALALVAVVAAAPPASGSPARSHPIRVGVGIGPVDLGLPTLPTRKSVGAPARSL